MGRDFCHNVTSSNNFRRALNPKFQVTHWSTGNFKLGRGKLGRRTRKKKKRNWGRGVGGEGNAKSRKANDRFRRAKQFVMLRPRVLKADENINIAIKLDGAIPSPLTKTIAVWRHRFAPTLASMFLARRRNGISRGPLWGPELSFDSPWAGGNQGKPAEGNFSDVARRKWELQADSPIHYEKRRYRRSSSGPPLARENIRRARGRVRIEKEVLFYSRFWAMSPNAELVRRMPSNCQVHVVHASQKKNPKPGCAVS